MDRSSDGVKEFERLRARLYSLIDEDPTKAIKEVRALCSETSLDPVLWDALKASILVDAGASICDQQAIAEGVDLFRELLRTYPEQADLAYNLGNALFALADQESYSGFDWYLTTAEIRREARSLFQRAVSLGQDHRISSQALTNLGNALWKGHRWAEAYDAYSRALEDDPTIAVASAGAVKVLQRCLERGIGDPEILGVVIARHLDCVRKNQTRIGELAGMHAQVELTKLLDRHVDEGSLPDLSKANEYVRFVAFHRLALSPTIEGLDCSLKRWDNLRIESITEPVGAGHGIPALFAMFNVLKSDYLAARNLAFQALSSEIEDSGFYSDTLDYAVYGVVPSMLSLAQRACMDVLDKIAVATTEYFGIPGAAKSINFANRWFTESKKGNPPAWHPSLRTHIDLGNTALIALGELCLDMREGGGLCPKKAFRHSSTHRFTILHDLGCEPSRRSSSVEHFTLNFFKSQLIESLQLARAAILYFVEMISNEESRSRAGSQTAGVMFVPSHHHIRGEDEAELDDDLPSLSKPKK
jgi:tetratricopeptide (TPR) repeat protein